MDPASNEDSLLHAEMELLELAWERVTGTKDIPKIVGDMFGKEPVAKSSLH